MALTDKQERFCQEYLKDLNASAAARRAGYSGKNSDAIGSELLGKTGVSERVKELMDKRSKRIELSADKVLSDIEEIRERCMQKEPVLDAEGEPTGEWKFESRSALKACELLGQHLALFTKKIEHSGTIGMTEEEIDRRLDELRAREKKQG